MKTRIIVITDLHYHRGGRDPAATRRGDLGDILLERAVRRINRVIRPDAVVLLGDLIDQGDQNDAFECITAIHKIASKLNFPVIALPGNHDGAPDTFYKVFDRPTDTIDIGHIRLAPFVDPQRPGYNAERLDRDMRRMRTLRGDFIGPVVTLQHVPLFPPGRSECPYHYINADRIIEAMAESGVTHAVSGHYHAGIDPIRTDRATFFTAKALCEHPFCMTELIFDGETMTAVPHHLAMDRDLALVDHHVHTPFAYCNENMSIRRSLELADTFGLASVTFAEHASHLYFDVQACARRVPLTEGIGSAHSNGTIAPYLAACGRANCRPDQVALEVEADYAGRPVLRAGDADRVAYRLGAVHGLAALEAPNPDPERVKGEFLGVLERFVPSGIRILAHPFRIFRRAGIPVDPALYGPVIALLRRHAVAAEINFHTNAPDPAFAAACVESGVKLTLGSDSHHLASIGDFTMHLDLLGRCGFNTGLDQILLTDHRSDSPVSGSFGSFGKAGRASEKGTEFNDVQ